MVDAEALEDVASVLFNALLVGAYSAFGILSGFGFETVRTEPLRILYSALVAGGSAGVSYLVLYRGLGGYVTPRPKGPGEED